MNTFGQILRRGEEDDGRKENDVEMLSALWGLLKRGTTTFTADLGFGVVVVRSVPARVCSQCGEDWIGTTEARLLEKIVDEARKKRHQVEVMSPD